MLSQLLGVIAVVVVAVLLKVLSLHEQEDSKDDDVSYHIREKETITLYIHDVTVLGDSNGKWNGALLVAKNTLMRW